MSSKRQATFPKRVCDALGIKSGDGLLLERRVEAGEEFWLLSPAQRQTRPWLGSLREYAVGKAHDMDAVRKSIAARRAASES